MIFIIYIFCIILYFIFLYFTIKILTFVSRPCKTPAKQPHTPFVERIRPHKCYVRKLNAGNSMNRCMNKQLHMYIYIYIYVLHLPNKHLYLFSTWKMEHQLAGNHHLTIDKTSPNHFQNLTISSTHSCRPCRSYRACCRWARRQSPRAGKLCGIRCEGFAAGLTDWEN